MRVLRAAAAKAGSVTVPALPVSPVPPGGGNPGNVGPESSPPALAQQVVAAMNTQVHTPLIQTRIFQNETLVVEANACVARCRRARIFTSTRAGGWNANNAIPSDKSSW